MLARSLFSLFALLIGSLVLVATASQASAQVRSKRQDRGVYQPPAVPAANDRSRTDADARRQADAGDQPIQQVGYESIDGPVLKEGEALPPGAYYDDGPYYEDAVYCDSYPGGGCDAGGCDGIDCRACRRCAAFSPWFGSAEVLLWWRRPQVLPALVTTSPDGTDSDLAGQLGEDDTSILFGADRYGKAMSAGGRFTLGKWLDPAQRFSLVGRFWLSGSENYGFSANSLDNPILARPFLNVTDDPDGENDAQLIAFTNELNGNVSVSGTSDMYGTDISFSQLCRQGLGGRIDLMYGYQYLRINEGLDIASETMVIGGTTFDIGSMITVRDQFDVVNEFHGGHVGFSGFHREGNWTLDGLVKFGFGNLSRRATLYGETMTASGGQTATDSNGLLVRSSNAGSYTDDTFAWVPELNLNVGYRWRPCVDLTVGYSLVVLTEALQPWRTIDSSLASDLSDDPSEPTANFTYGDHWAQGINFGIRWCY
ncbi:BBP7 family outer membrane beta-barrel protein [Roseimaritima ulvae]|nr:BBP7 family outer membrane beta-barrel protein [Roseimaritima ulvae]